MERRSQEDKRLYEVSSGGRREDSDDDEYLININIYEIILCSPIMLASQRERLFQNGSYV